LKTLRLKVDAAESAELARIRKKLKLSQRHAAAIAGGGVNAFSRYENGKARPVAAVVNLFRLLDKHPELIDEITV
jgi:HTH-type transcriptional regulator/antitoxin MqsA